MVEYSHIWHLTWQHENFAGFATAITGACHLCDSVHFLLQWVSFIWHFIALHLFLEGENKESVLLAFMLYKCVGALLGRCG